MSNLFVCLDKKCKLYNEITNSCAVSACIKPAANVNKMVSQTTKKKMSSEKIEEYLIKNKLRMIRDLNLRAKKEKDELFKLISDLYPNLELKKISTKVENSNNLEDAINYYLHYGEYDTKVIVKEIVEAGNMN